MPANGNSGGGKESGLAYWMQQVLKRAAQASRGFQPDDVHGLRVALRRCRSMAEVVLTFDPIPTWKRMRKDGKKLFNSLGDLRDCQVMMGWVRNLGDPGDLVTQRLTSYCVAREQELKTTAAQSLQDFDIEDWEACAGTLARRIRRFQPGSDLFQAIALERWQHARELHHAAMRSRSKVALHRLRIGTKKFRYVVENFLPTVHERIGNQLKEVQDLLGEVHDLDVLWDTALKVHAFEMPEERARWAERITEERKKRVETYRQRALGAKSLWVHWRELLPDNAQAARGTMKRLQCWASVLDPDYAHTRHVSALSLQLYDGLAKLGVFPVNGSPWRQWLMAASLLHDVGKKKGDKGHQRRTQLRIQELELPYGWKEEQRQMVALIARYHRGDWTEIPRSELGGLRAAAVRNAQKLGGVLRLANALDYGHDGAVHRIEVTRLDAGVLVIAEGLDDNTRVAEKIAAARHLLELRCGLPILVRGRS